MDKYNVRATVRNVSFLSTLITTTKDGKKRPSIRFWRIFTIVLVHLLFVLSYRVDVQILEGDISASRILGLLHHFWWQGLLLVGLPILTYKRDS